MSATLQLEEEVVAVHDSPMLAVHWSSRWQEFLGSIGPAFTRSEARLAGEAPFGLIPLRIMLPSYVVEACIILIAVFGYAKIEELRPSVAPRLPNHDVIYYSGDELPRTEDLGGADSGAQGRAGGDETRHHTQTIKVARGNSLVPKVVDAPNVKLPSTLDAVANLLAVRPNAGPPPAEGLRSTRSAPNLASALVAPAPNVVRDYTRNGVQLDPVIAPAPSLTRDRPLTAPSLNANLAAPAPNITSDHTLVAPQLAPIVAPPSANISRDRALVAPTLTPSVAAPAQDVHRDPFRPAPTLANNVVPPAPAAVSRQLSSAPVQMMDPSVVPPPVSAPEQASARTSKLSLPAPAVVAPPPSTDISSDMRRLASGSTPDPAKTVVPPPPTQAGSGSFMGSLIGRIFGPSQSVAPPPEAVTKTTTGTPTPSLPANVVAPPSATSIEATGNPRGNRSGRSATLDANVVAPPPSTGVAGGTGHSRSAAPYLGNPTVVPPPPALSGSGGGTGNIGGAAGSPAGTMASNVVPPPPSVSGGANSVGSGSGRKGPGLGTVLDPGSAATPANNSGSGNSGAIVSSQPGSKVGVPPNTNVGSLSMSPAGSDKSGLGGAGGGTSIARGNGPGSGLNGAGSGDAKTGAGHGSEGNAHGGISPTTGPGGAGTANSGNPAVRGVDISGGNGSVNLGSFGDDPSTVNPTSPGRSQTRQHSKSLDVTVVATSTSGGAFEPYQKLLHGEVSTTYIDSSLGTVVMEFADQGATTSGFNGGLTPPAALRNDLPEGLPRARLVITCILDAEGNLKNPRVLEAGPAGVTAKVLAALRAWKFQPAMRNNQPVEVTTILGFGINTDDRF